jgi:hypothetical protein
MVGFVALLNDAVTLAAKERKKVRDSSTGVRLRGNSHPVVPAVKIARLGVCSTFKTGNGGIGTALVRFAYVQALSLDPKVGCRLLTVDAYPHSVKFYERLGFVFNLDKRYEGKEHPSMRLDLYGETPPTFLP